MRIRARVVYRSQTFASVLTQVKPDGNLPILPELLAVVIVVVENRRTTEIDRKERTSWTIPLSFLGFMFLR